MLSMYDMNSDQSWCSLLHAKALIWFSHTNKLLVMFLSKPKWYGTFLFVIWKSDYFKGFFLNFSVWNITLSWTVFSQTSYRFEWILHNLMAQRIIGSNESPKGCKLVAMDDNSISPSHTYCPPTLIGNNMQKCGAWLLYIIVVCWLTPHLAYKYMADLCCKIPEMSPIACIHGGLLFQW